MNSLQGPGAALCRSELARDELRTTSQAPNSRLPGTTDGDRLAGLSQNRQLGIGVSIVQADKTALFGGFFVSVGMVAPIRWVGRAGGLRARRILYPVRQLARFRPP